MAPPSTGSGKSTIVQLLLRLYTPQSGLISIGGCDLNGIDPKWLRRHVAVVEQGPVLFSGSFLDNIAFGSAHTDVEDEPSIKDGVTVKDSLLGEATRAAKLANVQ